MRRRLTKKNIPIITNLDIVSVGSAGYNYNGNNINVSVSNLKIQVLPNNIERVKLVCYGIYRYDFIDVQNWVIEYLGYSDPYVEIRLDRDFEDSMGFYWFKDSIFSKYLTTNPVSFSFSTTHYAISPNYTDVLVNNNYEWIPMRGYLEGIYVDIYIPNLKGLPKGLKTCTIVDCSGNLQYTDEFQAPIMWNEL